MADANVIINVVDGCVCPLCGGNEVLLGGPVRPFKVHNGGPGGWSSHCTACDVWFDERNWIEVDLRAFDLGVRTGSIEWIAGMPLPGSDEEPQPKLDALILKCREIVNGAR